MPEPLFKLDLPVLAAMEPDPLSPAHTQALMERLNAEAPEKRAVSCTFVRLVEHAVREYRLAAAEVAQQSGTEAAPGLHYLRATTCLESCMTSMHRAAQCLRALEGLGLAPTVRRSHGVRSDLALVALAGMRNATQHLDKRVLANQSGTGQIAPVTRDGDLCIANASVRIELLVAWLRELHEIAGQLLGTALPQAR